MVMSKNIISKLRKLNTESRKTVSELCKRIEHMAAEVPEVGSIIKKTEAFTFKTIMFSELRSWDVSRMNYSEQFHHIADALRGKTPAEAVTRLRRILTMGGILYDEGDDWYEALLHISPKVLQAIADKFELSYDQSRADKVIRKYEKEDKVIWRLIDGFREY